MISKKEWWEYTKEKYWYTILFFEWIGFEECLIWFWEMEQLHGDD